eukprot:c24853_g2_i2 orf=287-1402(+)
MGEEGGSDKLAFPSLDMSDLEASLPLRTSGLPPADPAVVGNSLKHKHQYLAGEQLGVLESFSPNVKKRVAVLQDIQKTHDEIEAKYFEEKAALQARYQKLYEPLYSKRNEIVNGHVEVEGITRDAVQSDGPAEETKEKGVPDFWLIAMKTNEVLALQISERDEGALKYLKDIKYSRIDNPKGFKLEFYFDTNPYFKNTVLTKAYHMVDNEEPILERAVGTVIEWHAGKNLTEKVLRKKPKKGSRNTKPVTKTEQCESFFNFFKPPQVPEDDDDIDQDVAEELQDLMEQDYDIGSTIRDKIIPHAVSWFTGEALQGEELEVDDDGTDTDDDDEEEEEEDEGEEDEDEDDDEEEEEEEKGRKIRLLGSSRNGI